MKQFGGNVLFLDRSDINTDEIIPAKYLTEISKQALKPYLLEDLKLDGFNPKTDVAGKKVIITRENFGCGSSREHAALGPMYLGVRAIITKSFAIIHKANLINYGIIPITFVNPADYDIINQDDVLEITNIEEALDTGCEFNIVVNGKTIKGTNDLAQRSRNILKQGGLAAYTRNGGN